MRYPINKMIIPKGALQERSPRRGAIWPLVVAILALLIAGLALAVDAAMLWQARQEIQVAVDASSLAAVQQFADDQLLLHRPGLMWDMVQRADETARHYALDHHVLGSPLSLQSANSPTPDIVFGFFNALDNTIQPAWPNQWDSPLLNAVEVTGKRFRERGNAVGLFFARFLRLPASDVAANAIAVLDRQLIGFRPWGTVAVPLMPLALLSDPSGLEEHSWEAQVDRPLSQGGGGQDQFAWDRQSRRWFSSGNGDQTGDGLPEFTLRLPLSTGSSQIRNGKVLRFASAEPKRWLRQVGLGLLAEDLSAYNGQLALGADGNVQVLEGTLPENNDFDRFLEILEKIHESGEPRIYPLYEPIADDEQANPAETRPSPMVVLRGFVAARIASVQVTDGNDPTLMLVLQPTVLLTSTALNQPTAEANAYIAKARLLR